MASFGRYSVNTLNVDKIHEIFFQTRMTQSLAESATIAGTSRTMAFRARSCGLLRYQMH